MMQLESSFSEYEHSIKFVAGLNNEFSASSKVFDSNKSNFMHFENVILEFSNYLKIVNDFYKKEKQPNSPKNVLKYFLKRMDYHLSDIFINQIDESDLVEIYNIKNIQVFRTLNFFEMTSYSLSELLFNDWNNLYLRPQKVLNEIEKILTKLLIESHEILSLKEIGEYCLMEKFSKNKFVANVTNKNISLVYSGSSKDPIGYVVNSKVQLLPIELNCSLSFI